MVVNMDILTVIKKNKKLLIIFSLFLVIFPIGIFSLKNVDYHMVPPIPPAITQEPTISIQKQIVLVTTYPTSVPSSDPQKRLIDRISNRRPLNQQDQQAKSAILATLPNNAQSGTVYEGQNFIIEYIQAPDLFKVEIGSMDITTVKRQAVAWFLNKGFTQQGICDLPLSFYLNFDMSNQLRNQQTQFDPLPDGC